MGTLQFGYLLDTHGGPYGQGPASTDAAARFTERLLDEAAAAEAAGFDAIFIPERHARPECHVPSIWVLLGALAARLKSAHIGTYVALAPLHHPVHVAESLAVLDNLTRGRVIAGLASGYNDLYWNAFGLAKRGSAARVEETVEILRRAWSEASFSFLGAYFNLQDVSIYPRPYREDGPPIWLGGESKGAVVRAGRIGDGWAAGSFPWDLDRWKTALTLYRESAASAGRRPIVAMLRDGLVAEGTEAADSFVPIATAELRYYLERGLRPRHPDFRDAANIDGQKLREHLIVGSPSECLERVQAMRSAYDLDWLVVRFRLPNGPSRERVLESIALFGEEIIEHEVSRK